MKGQGRACAVSCIALVPAGNWRSRLWSSVSTSPCPVSSPSGNRRSCGTSSGRFRWIGFLSKPTRRSWRRSETRQAQRAGLRCIYRRHVAEVKGIPVEELAHGRRRISFVSSTGCRRQCHEDHGSRVRRLRRRSADRWRLGRLRSREPEEPAQPSIDPGRGSRRPRLVDSGPDVREQLIAAGVTWLTGVVYTHSHADHTHGMDDLRGINVAMAAPLDIYADRARWTI